MGGGIFLSPVLLLLGWAGAKRTAAVSVAFILVNSAAGLLGHLASLERIPPQVALWAPVVLVGGAVGSTLGSRVLPGRRSGACSPSCSCSRVSSCSGPRYRPTGRSECPVQIHCPRGQ